jgi:hypothetical protein
MATLDDPPVFKSRIPVRPSLDETSDVTFAEEGAGRPLADAPGGASLGQDVAANVGA